jgi:hypothetical protein
MQIKNSCYSEKAMCEIRFRLTGYWEIDINWDLYPRAIREVRIVF